MKQYAVDVDITMSKRIYVDAESEEQAKTIVNNRIGDDPYHYARTADGYVEHKITEVNEEEHENKTEQENKTELDKALDYVREQMDEDDMAILHAEMNKCYKMHLIPDGDTMDCTKVIDLLEEYGDDNELPEGWWMEYGEIDDILVKL